jgi:hypothetical protein
MLPTITETIITGMYLFTRGAVIETDGKSTRFIRNIVK